MLKQTGFKCPSSLVSNVCTYVLLLLHICLPKRCVTADRCSTHRDIFVHTCWWWISLSQCIDSRVSSSNIPKVGSKRWSCGKVIVAHFTIQFLFRGRGLEQESFGGGGGLLLMEEKGGEEEIGWTNREERNKHSTHANTIVIQKLLSRGWMGQWAQSAGQGPTIGSAVTICVKPTVRSGPHRSKSARLWLHVRVYDIPTVSNRDNL